MFQIARQGPISAGQPQTNARQGIIFGSYNTEFNNIHAFTFEIYENKTVRVYNAYYNGSGYVTADFKFSKTLTAGVDTHIAVTMTRTSTSVTAILYVNGTTEEMTKTVSNFDTSQIPNNYPITVGNDFRRDETAAFGKSCSFW